MSFFLEVWKAQNHETKHLLILTLQHKYLIIKNY